MTRGPYEPGGSLGRGPLGEFPLYNHLVALHDSTDEVVAGILAQDDYATLRDKWRNMEDAWIALQEGRPRA